VTVKDDDKNAVVPETPSTISKDEKKKLESQEKQTKANTEPGQQQTKVNSSIGLDNQNTLDQILGNIHNGGEMQADESAIPAKAPPPAKKTSSRFYKCRKEKTTPRPS